MPDELRISNVIRWENGTVMVFDQHGEQMPRYQGTWVECREDILRDKPEHVEVGKPQVWGPRQRLGARA